MTNTRVHPAKRVITFIMALLMMLSSFVYFSLPSTSAAPQNALSDANWHGWYECFRSDPGYAGFDAGGNFWNTSWGANMIAGYNPLYKINESKITCIDRHNTNRGWDDFVAVSSDYATNLDKGVSITVNMQTGTGGAEVISDVQGRGSFSIAFLTADNDLSNATAFTNYLYGTMYGLAGAVGLVVNFTAEPGSTSYYDYCELWFNAGAGPQSLTGGKIALDPQMAMADGTAPVTLKFEKAEGNGYNLVLSGNGITKTLYSNAPFQSTQPFYYAVGAFTGSLNLGEATQPLTSPAFTIDSVRYCKDFSSATIVDNGHNYTIVTTDGYSVQKCQNTKCNYYGQKYYNVTYDLNGGKNGPASYIKEFSCNNNPDVNGRINISDVVPEKENHVFLGWLCSYDDTVYPANGSVSVPRHVTFTAQWAPLYTLTLDGNGGTIDGYATKDYPIYNGQTYKDAFSKEFPTPVYDGYQFKGYYYNDNFTLTEENWENTYTLTDDGEMTAIWECLHPESSRSTVETVAPTCYSVGTANIVCGQCGEVVGTEEIPMVDHNFYEWASTGKGYDINQCRNSGCSEFTKKRIEVSYYATWGSFSDNTKYKTEYYWVETGDENASVPITPSDAVTPIPPTDKIFLGWSRTHDGAVETISSSTVSISLYAIYVDIPKCTVSFDTNGAGISYDSITVVKGQKYGTLPEPEWEGHRFLGWYDAVEGGNEITADSVCNVSGTQTLYAHWESPYKITFDPNGGELPEEFDAEQYIYYDDRYLDVIGDMPIPDRDGYEFLGWGVNGSRYNAPNWAEDAAYKVNGDSEFVAEWARINTLTFDANGGTMTVGTSAGGNKYTFEFLKGQSYEEVIGTDTPPVPVRAGYTFLYWAYNGNPFWYPNDTINWDNATYPNDTDLEVNAVWDKILVCDHVFTNKGEHTNSSDSDYKSAILECSTCKAVYYGFKITFNSRGMYLNAQTQKTIDRSYELSADVAIDQIYGGDYMYIDGYLLSDTENLTVEIIFDPMIRGANATSRAAFYGWNTSVRNDGGAADFPKSGEATFKGHTDLYACYQAGFCELLFDATQGGENSYAPYALLVQENRNYAVAAVSNRDLNGNGFVDNSEIAIKSYIDYLPSMKYVNGQLYVANAWATDPSGLDLDVKDLQDGEIYANYTDALDTIWMPGHNVPNGNKMSHDYGAETGRMLTYYANNKGALNIEAHYDPEYRGPGTMYYRYYVDVDENGERQYDGSQKLIINYEPCFTIDPAHDTEDPRYYERDHESYHDPFDPWAYFAGTSNNEVIVKDPRKYTVFVAHDDYYVFPIIVSAPDGTPYKAEGKENGIYNYDITDPDFIDNEVYVEAVHPDKNISKGGKYIVYKSTADNKLPEFKAARDYTGQYDSNSERFPLYYAYFDNHKYVDYSVTTNSDGSSQFNMDSPANNRGSMNARGFLPLTDKYEPLWSFGGGSSLTRFVYTDSEVAKENHDGFPMIMQYTYPETGLLSIPNFVLNQYSAYHQWETKITFDANMPAGMINNSTDYGYTGTETTETAKAYMYTSSHGDFYTPDANLFTRNRYVIVGWTTSKTRADNNQFDPDKDYDVGDKLTSLESCRAFGTPTTLYAIWRPVVTFTLEEGEDGYGDDHFAVVTYFDAKKNASNTAYFNETKTLKTFSQTAVTINMVSVGSVIEDIQYTYSYLTLNQNNAPMNADRIITTGLNYSFTIFDDTAMTAQFVPIGSKTVFYIDRNNKLLRNNSDVWRLYTALPTRVPAGVMDSTKVDNALYYTYKDNTPYTITVNGSTYEKFDNDSYPLPYDDVLTVMTGPTDANGNKFVGWQIENGDKDMFVSYDLIYKHRVTSEETITAVYLGDTAPTISIIESGTANSRDFFIAQRAATDRYELKETGFIATKTPKTNSVGAVIPFSVGDLYDSNGEYDTSYYKIVSTDMSNDGTFKLMLPDGNTFYVVAYAYYYDTEEEEIIPLISDWVLSE